MIEWLFVPAAYLIGSISSAIIICRMMGLPDPREQGSGNPGATNVMRIGGKKAAAITLLGDLLKGLIPVYSAHLLGLSAELLAITGLAAFIGHRSVLQGCAEGILGECFLGLWVALPCGTLLWGILFFIEAIRDDWFIVYAR